MIDHLTLIVLFMVDSFLHIWPYLLITIPLAVAVNLSGASRYINRAFVARPLVAIVLATAVGAFSPFCSCGVVPVVAALLIGGVPLAPVMAFWIASPSMDPEIFFLSVGMLGWELAVWRLAGALALSLSAGFLTHVVVQKGWLGSQILRTDYQTSKHSARRLVQEGWQRIKTQTALAFSPPPQPVTAVPQPHSIALTVPITAVAFENTAASGESCARKPPSFRQKLWQETWKATSMVVKFMALAFFLEAIILLLVPQEWIIGLLGEQNRWAVPLAALLGVPIYTSNLTALPLISGLLAQGMNPGAALAFLIAGPTTTLPAMAAVWGLVKWRVFALYVSFALIGAVIMGMLYNLMG
ncbi:MAG: permease [Anaerolineae bacterium]|nr:permease [Anaerolineae bacterium]